MKKRVFVIFLKFTDKPAFSVVTWIPDLLSYPVSPMSETQRGVFRERWSVQMLTGARREGNK